MPRSATAFAPGRVNLIGEHTDYNDGLALPFAIAEGVTVQARELDQPLVRVSAEDLEESDSFPLAEPPPPVEGWRAYARGAVAELSRAGLFPPRAGADGAPHGVELRITATLPRGSGLSSSAALEVALVLALLGLSGTDRPLDLELAQICARIEHRWAGAQTGLMDQLASLAGQDGCALRIDFRSLEVTPVPLGLGKHRLAILDSGESHSNAASGYNRRREECAEACELLGVSSLREVSPRQARSLPAPLSARVEHVISEIARVDEAVAALREGDIPRLGKLLNASHASLRDLYEVSTPAVERAVARLMHAGALGARIMGGGFGGSVLGLLPPRAELPDDAIEVRPGRGADLLDE